MNDVATKKAGFHMLFTVVMFCGGVACDNHPWSFLYFKAC